MVNRKICKQEKDDVLGRSIVGRRIGVTGRKMELHQEMIEWEEWRCRKNGAAGRKWYYSRKSRSRKSDVAGRNVKCRRMVQQEENGSRKSWCIRFKWYSGRYVNRKKMKY